MGETRPRPVPTPWTLVDRQGVTHTYDVDQLTVLVAVKTNCDGCRPFYRSALETLDGLAVVVASHDDPAHADYDNAVRPVMRAPALLDALDVRWPPFYVVVAPDPPRVIVEGVAFSPDQVADEISSRLARDSGTGHWSLREGTA